MKRPRGHKVRRILSGIAKARKKRQIPGFRHLKPQRRNKTP